MPYSAAAIADRPVLPLPPIGRHGWPWDADVQRRREFASPRVTLVTPSFNQGRYLEATIRSVLLQGYDNLEYFVMDGGSTDDSIAIIKRYEPWLAGWESQHDGGQAAAINKGWARATGDFMGWLNSDDVLAPGMLHRVVGRLEREPTIALVYGDLHNIDELGRIIDTDRFPPFDRERLVGDAAWLAQPGSLMRRAVYDTVGGLDERWQFMLDHEYWLRASVRFGFAHEPSVVAWFRRHADSKTLNHSATAASEIVELYDEFFSDPGLPAFARQLEQRGRASSYLHAASAWHFAGRRLAAWRSAIRAWRMYPPLLATSRTASIVGQLTAATLLGGRDAIPFRVARRLARRMMPAAIAPT